MKEKKTLKKKIILIFIPILVLLVILGFLVAFKLDKDKNNNSNNTLTNEESDVSYTFSNVYLMDNDNMLIPLSVKYQTIDNKAEELMYLMSLLKEDSEIANKQFKGVIPSSTKVNSMVAMIKAGVNGRVAMEQVDLFPDVAQAWADSKKTIEDYQKSLIKKDTQQPEQKKEMSDLSDQTGNSPILDGMKTNNGGDDDVQES